MRPVLRAVALALAAAVSARATQISYIDQGSRGSRAGRAPRRRRGSGTRAARSPRRARWVTTGPTTTEASWCRSGSTSSGRPADGLHLLSGEPFDIPSLTGSSLVGERWVGINENAGSADDNIVVEAPGGQGPFSTTFSPWFHATGARAVDVEANGSTVGVIYRINNTNPYALGLFAAGGLGVALPGASCDLPTVGDVDAVSFSQDGTWVAWTDDRGLLVAPTPPLGSGSPCPLASAPTVISATGSYPSIGATTLATPPASTPVTPPGPGATPTPPATPTPTPSVSSKPAVAVAKAIKASAFAKGLAVVVTVARKGTVTVTGKVGATTLARTSATAKKAGRVRLTLKASRTLARRLGRYKGKTLTLTVKAPGGTVTVKRKLQ